MFLKLSYMIDWRPRMDSSFLRNSFRTAAIIIKWVTIHIVEPGLVLKAICLLLLVIDPAHHVKVPPYLFLSPDPFFMLPHQPVHRLIHPILQLILEVSLHIRDHCVDILSNSLVL